MRILLSIFLLITQVASAKDLYVSVNGNDKNPGTKVLPFATLERAKLEARKYKKEVVKVFIMQGTYYLQKPLVFDAMDTRDEYVFLLFTPLPGQHPIIKGSRKLSLVFKPYKNGILQAALPASFPEIDQLFVNGALQVMARYPNYQEHVMPLHGTAPDALSAARVRNWANPAGGYIHALHASEWGGMHYRITGKNTDSALSLEGGWQNNRPSAMHKTYRYVENIFEELDTAGEWYADRAKNILYYKPTAGVDMSKALIEVPVLENLITFRGTPNESVCGIIMEDIRFEHTLRTFMKNKEPLLRSDWTIYRSGAIDFEYAQRCVIDKCDLFSLGGNAVMLSNYNKDNMVKGCHIAQIGGSAISFVGNPKAVRSPAFRYENAVPYAKMDTIPGPLGKDFPSSCLVFNNLIHDIGLVEKQVAGVQLSMCQQIKVQYNTIYNVPRAGINVSEGTWGGHEIAYNDVFNTVQETGDHGAFNSWGRDRYWHPNRAVMDFLMEVHPDLWKLDAVLPTEIHHNRFRCDNGWDIDLDDGSSNYHIYGNVCLNGGLKLREGFHRKVENNIILNNSFHPHVWFRNSGDTFQYNIVSGPYLPIRVPDWGKGIDHNFFPDEAALRKTQQWGVDAHSLAGDPQFINAATGDYKLKDSSRALLVGFQNTKIEVGVVSERLRKLAAAPPLPVMLQAVANASATHIFLDMKVKNLNTLAERSATGMDRETGVLVLEVPAAAAWSKLVQPNDVILELAGTPVNNIQDLLNAKTKVQWHATAPVVIFRNQQRLEIKVPLK
jgi:hypothetical protein